jgi:hypothetical protein
MAGAQECLLVAPEDAFRFGYLYPTRHIYDGASQFHFQMCGRDRDSDSDSGTGVTGGARCNTSSAFVLPPTLQNERRRSAGRRSAGSDGHDDDDRDDRGDDDGDDNDGDGGHSGRDDEDDTVFAGRVLRVTMAPSTVLLVPSFWLVQCVAVRATGDIAEEVTSTPAGASYSVPMSLTLRVSSTSVGQVGACA